MAIQSFPRPVHPKVKKQTDDQIAKVGQLNQLVRDVNQLATNPSSPVSYPFMWYPDAGLTSNGPKFTYTDGVELISYHIKGIASINASDGFQIYLCTINFPDGQPFIMPGSITGMFQSGGGEGNIITSPLANGGLVDIYGEPFPVSNFQIILQPYGNNPQEDGSYNYGLVMSGVVLETGVFTALIAYDFEFLLPNDTTPPTIFQD